MDRARALDAARTMGFESKVAVQLLGQGQFCSAFLIDADTVVRFPKHELGRQALVAERQVVAPLHDRVAVSLPVPLDSSLDSPIGAAFAAHRLVPGEIVTRSLLDDLAPEAVDQLAAQLAQFLNDLASQSGRHGACPERSVAEVASELSIHVEHLLANRMSDSQRDRAIRELGRLGAAGDAEHSLCHCDLGGNLVWDHDARRLGVIDFGSALVSDPLFDLASLASLHVALAADVASRTGHLVGRMPEVAAVIDTFALQDLVHSARQQDWAGVEAILANY